MRSLVVLLFRLRLLVLLDRLRLGPLGDDHVGGNAARLDLGTDALGLNLRFLVGLGLECRGFLVGQDLGLLALTLRLHLGDLHQLGELLLLGLDRLHRLKLLALDGLGDGQLLKLQLLRCLELLQLDHLLLLLAVRQLLQLRVLGLQLLDHCQTLLDLSLQLRRNLRLFALFARGDAKLLADQVGHLAALGQVGRLQIERNDRRLQFRRQGLQHLADLDHLLLAIGRRAGHIGQGDLEANAGHIVVLVLHASGRIDQRLVQDHLLLASFFAGHDDEVGLQCHVLDQQIHQALAHQAAAVAVVVVDVGD